MELITIRTFNNYFSAHILLTKLKSAGIECYLNDESTVTIGPHLSNAIGGIKLVIKSTDAQEVSFLLHQLDEEFRKTASCPKCGRNDIELVAKKSPANFLTAILSWLFSNYAMSVKNVYQCSSCKYESAVLPEPFYFSPVVGEERLN